MTLDRIFYLKSLFFVLFVNELDALLDVSLELLESRIDQLLLIFGDLSNSKRLLNSLFLYFKDKS